MFGLSLAPLKVLSFLLELLALFPLYCFFWQLVEHVPLMILKVSTVALKEFLVLPTLYFSAGFFKPKRYTISFILCKISAQELEQPLGIGRCCKMCNYFFSASLQCVTMEGWTPILYWVRLLQLKITATDYVF